jgi:uncharacterized protein YggE
MKQDEDGTLNVSGYGRVLVMPDAATVQLAVVTEAKTAAEASQTNAAVMQQVLDAVTALPHDRVRTTGLGVMPITTYHPDTQTTTITGYRAFNGISVDTKVGDAGRIFDAGIAAGANESSGITFRLSDERPHREEALRIAVKEAHADASVVAVTANTVLTGVSEIEIDPAGPPLFRMMESARADVPTPVVPGEIAVEARVRMKFRFQRS